MSEKLQLGNVELPLFKILFNNDLFSSIEVSKLDVFLIEIGLTQEDIATYKQLQKMDILNIDIKKVKLYNDHVLELFSTMKSYILFTISESDVFKDLLINLNKKIIVDKNKVLEIIFQYIKFGLLSLVTNYETQRISNGIFNIVNKK
ncbi:MAG: hypothetical protein PHV23_01130 [Candidatus Gracilibacteria bacterium]|nr:hypothetical protein [Candidatus Gracilibacteria bacterium]